MQYLQILNLVGSNLNWTKNTQVYITRNIYVCNNSFFFFGFLLKDYYFTILITRYFFVVTFKKWSRKSKSSSCFWGLILRSTEVETKRDMHICMPTYSIQLLVALLGPHADSKILMKKNNWYLGPEVRDGVCEDVCHSMTEAWSFFLINHFLLLNKGG